MKNFLISLLTHTAAFICGIGLMFVIVTAAMLDSFEVTVRDHQVLCIPIHK